MPTMKDIYEIRRDNLVEILRGIASEMGENDIRKATGPLATRLGIAQNWVSQWKSEKKPRKINDKMARLIETELNLEYGHMDNVNHEGLPKIFKETLIFLEKALAQESIRVSPERKADILELLLSFYTPENPPTVQNIRRVIRTLL